MKVFAKKNLKELNNEQETTDNLRTEAESKLSKNGNIPSKDEINNYVDDAIEKSKLDKEYDNDNYSSLTEPSNLDEINPEMALDMISEGGYGDFDENGKN